MKTRIKSKSSTDKATSSLGFITKRKRKLFPRVFPFSFVFCLLYLLSSNVAAASLLLLASSFVVSFLSSLLAQLCIHVSFHPTQIYFNPQARYTKVISLLLAAADGAGWRTPFVLRGI